MRRSSYFAALPVAIMIGASFTASAYARPGRHHVEVSEKISKTHRILANSSAIRINDAGQVITNEKP